MRKLHLHAPGCTCTSAPGDKAREVQVMPDLVHRSPMSNLYCALKLQHSEKEASTHIYTGGPKYQRWSGLLSVTGFHTTFPFQLKQFEE